MANISVNISIDQTLKEESDRFFASLGLSLASAITGFLRQSVREQRFLLSSSYLSGKALTEKALADSQNDVDIHGPFNTFAGMMADINADS